jgi:AcrR family transcriptional regulator
MLYSVVKKFITLVPFMIGERGRPRAFDIDTALDKAVSVFWKHGFQGASLSDLTEAMGLSKPSIYAAYGDKKSLYLKALERYIGILGDHVKLLTDEPDGRIAVEIFLNSLTDMLTNPNLPGGCFIVTGTTDLGGSTIPDDVADALRFALQISENILNERLLQAQRDGQIPQSINPKDLAGLFSTLISGLAIQAKSGTSAEQLKRNIAMAMNIWP